MLDVLLPDGNGLVAALEAYFDESGRGTEAKGVFAVCGYLFEPFAARQYAAHARRIFGPYGGAHMKTLVHRTGAFEGISEKERDDLVKASVELVNRYVTAGVTVSCWKEDISRFAPNFIVGFRHAYSVCAHFAAANMGHWVRDRWPHGCGGILYFFEEQKDLYPDADAFLSNAKWHPAIREMYQYKNHASALKAETPPLWAADLIAWEWAKYWDETVASPKRHMRRSLEALLRPGWDFSAGRNPKYRFFHLGGDSMLRYMATARDLGLSQLQGEDVALQSEELSLDSEE